MQNERVIVYFYLTESSMFRWNRLTLYLSIQTAVLHASIRLTEKQLHCRIWSDKDSEGVHEIGMCNARTVTLIIEKPMFCDQMHEEESFQPKSCLAVPQQDKINQIRHLIQMLRGRQPSYVKCLYTLVLPYWGNVVQMIHNFSMIKAHNEIITFRLDAAILKRWE